MPVVRLHRMPLCTFVFYSVALRVCNYWTVSRNSSFILPYRTHWLMRNYNLWCEAQTGSEHPPGSLIRKRSAISLEKTLQCFCSAGWLSAI